MQTSNSYKPRITALILVIFCVLSTWIMQNSINAYYLQTYHKPSPLQKLDDKALWRFGGKIGDQLYQWHGDLVARIHHGNDVMMNHFNKHYAFDEQYLENQRRLQEAHLRKIQAAAEARRKNDEALRQKLRYTLKAGDAIFFAGDSMMQGVAPHLQQQLSKHGIISINLSKQSTGLAYPQLFNWQQTIKTTLNANPKIKILVIFLGPNDPWDMPDPKTGQILKFGNPDWVSVYKSRMADIVDSANEHDVAVIWITPPSMKKTKLNEHMITLTAIMKEELSRHDILLIDSRQLLKTTDNIYKDYTDNNGKIIKMRSGDGIHFTLEGQKLIANYVYQQLIIE